jgi:hypothetical protein
MNTSNIFRNAGLLVHPAETARDANCCCLECLRAVVSKEKEKEKEEQVSTLNTVNKSN